jgi:hypothetical protein
MNNPGAKLYSKTSRLHCKTVVVLILFIFRLSSPVFCQPKPGHFCKLNNKSNSFTISGTVTQTSSYCGGAMPPKELLDRMATPVAYPNKKFYIRKGKVNSATVKIVASFITDSSGTFSLRLAPGVYSIIVEEQLNEIKAATYIKQHQVVDKKCLQEWWAKPYYVLEIKNADITNLNFNFHHRCYIDNDIPCITYNGPVHP